MKEAFLWAIGIVAMVILGYITAFSAQELVWLLVPGVGMILAILAISRILR